MANSIIGAGIIGLPFSFKEAVMDIIDSSRPTDALSGTTGFRDGNYAFDSVDDRC